MTGAAVGLRVGAVGLNVGDAVCAVGAFVGLNVGYAVGLFVGLAQVRLSGVHVPLRQSVCAVQPSPGQQP